MPVSYGDIPIEKDIKQDFLKDENITFQVRTMWESQVENEY